MVRATPTSRTPAKNMKNPTPITFDEFIAHERKNVGLFKTWWTSQRKNHPKHFPKKMWSGDWNEQYHLFDPNQKEELEIEEEPSPREFWEDKIHELRNQINWGQTFCKTFEMFECPGQSIDLFFQGCLITLASNNPDGVAEFINRLDNALSIDGETPETVHKLWNHPKHPIRNFLISRIATYPEIRP